MKDVLRQKTAKEIAAELGVSTHRLLNAIRAERWAASLRSVTMDCLNANDGAYGYTTRAEAEAIAQMGIGAILISEPAD